MIALLACSASMPGTAATISGEVEGPDHRGVPGVGITVSGANATATTDSSGKYTLENLKQGNYVVTATLGGGFIFAPPGQAVTLMSKDVSDVNFTSIGDIPGTEHIGGKITGPGSAKVEGITVALSSPRATITTTTQKRGTFIFVNVVPGEYSVSPLAQGGLKFNPASRTVTVGSAYVSNINFKLNGSSAAACQIYGQIKGQAGVKLSDIVVSLSLPGSKDVSMTAKTEAHGFFVFVDLAPGDYVITPKSAGLILTPAFRIVTVTNAHTSSAAFTASSASPTGPLTLPSRSTGFPSPT